MELKDAAGIMVKADELYHKLMVQHDSMRGVAPTGREGIPVYSTLEEILEHVKRRRIQILRLRAAIAELATKRDSNVVAKELREIAEELKL